MGCICQKKTEEQIVILDNPAFSPYDEENYKKLKSGDSKNKNVVKISDNVEDEICNKTSYSAAYTYNQSDFSNKSKKKIIINKLKLM